MALYQVVQQDVEAFQLERPVEWQGGASQLPAGGYMVIWSNGQTTYVHEDLFNLFFRPALGTATAGPTVCPGPPSEEEARRRRSEAARQAWQTRREREAAPPRVRVRRDAAAGAQRELPDRISPDETFTDCIRISLQGGPKTAAEIEQDLRDSGINPRPYRVSQICNQRMKAGEFGRDKEGRWHLE